MPRAEERVRHSEIEYLTFLQNIASYAVFEIALMLLSSLRRLGWNRLMVRYFSTAKIAWYGPVSTTLLNLRVETDLIVLLYI